MRSIARYTTILLESGVGKEFASQRDLNPVALLVRLLVDMGGEGDGTHDPIAKFLLNDTFVGWPVVLHDFKEPVDGWVARRQIEECSPRRTPPRRELLLQILPRDGECGGELVEVLSTGLGLAVEERRCGHLVPSNALAQGVPRQLVLLLSLEHAGAHGRKARNLVNHNLVPL